MYENITQNTCTRFFDTPVKDFFSLDISETGPIFPQLVDLDNDKDFDLFLLTNKNNPGGAECILSNKREFYLNTGTVDCPEFTKHEEWPYGIPDDLTTLKFADIDGDMDLDLFSFTWCWDSKIKFIENTGTRSEPFFGDASELINPFGLDPETIWSANPAVC